MFKSQYLSGLKAVLAALLALSGALAAAAAETNSILGARVYGHLEQFNWKETLAGMEVVRDSGLLYGLGADVAINPLASLLIEGNGEFFFGNVDYDGFIQDVSRFQMIPYQSRTQYLGIKGSGDIGLKLGLTDYFYLKPFLDIGADAWQRKLDDTGSRTYGYDEYWLTTFAFAGLGAGAPLADRVELYGRAQLNLSIYNLERVDMSNLGGPSDVYLNPGREPSFSAEAGINIHFVSVALFYETLRFSQSDLDDKYGRYLQPESRADIYGLKLGAVF